MSTETTAHILGQHGLRGYQFGPDRLMTVTCACGEVTASDEYDAADAHVAADEVHAWHQAEVLEVAIPGLGADNQVQDDVTQLATEAVTRVFGWFYRSGINGTYKDVAWVAVDAATPHLVAGAKAEALEDAADEAESQGKTEVTTRRLRTRARQARVGQ